MLCNRLGSELLKTIVSPLYCSKVDVETMQKLHGTCFWNFIVEDLSALLSQLLIVHAVCAWCCSDANIYTPRGPLFGLVASIYGTAVPLAVSVRLQCLPNLFPTFVTHPRESEHSSRTLSESGVCRPKFAPEHSKKVVRRKRG